MSSLQGLLEYGELTVTTCETLRETNEYSQSMAHVMFSRNYSSTFSFHTLLFTGPLQKEVRCASGKAF